MFFCFCLCLSFCSSRADSMASRVRPSAACWACKSPSIPPSIASATAKKAGGGATADADAPVLLLLAVAGGGVAVPFCCCCCCCRRRSASSDATFAATPEGLSHAGKLLGAAKGLGASVTRRAASGRRSRLRIASHNAASLGTSTSTTSPGRRACALAAAATPTILCPLPALLLPALLFATPQSRVSRRPTKGSALPPPPLPLLPKADDRSISGSTEVTWRHSAATAADPPPPPAAAVGSRRIVITSR